MTVRSASPLQAQRAAFALPDAQLALSSATYSVGEGGGAIVITVNRTGCNACAVSVAYTTTGNGNATTGTDYLPKSGTLTFAPGVTSQTFSVPIIEDVVFEGNETFSVAISSPGGGATLGAITTATVTIVDNDPGPADLSITKTASGNFFVGLNATYSIVVSNSGPNAAAAVAVTDVLPAGATFVSASPSQGSCSGTTTVTCTLGTISSGGSASIALIIRPNVAGPLNNSATASAFPQPDFNPANNTSSAQLTVAPASAIPALDATALAILAAMLAAIGAFVVRK